MKQSKLIYTIGFKTAGGGYDTAIRKFTVKQFETYWDNIVAEGGKVIGYTTQSDIIRKEE